MNEKTISHNTNRKKNKKKRSNNDNTDHVQANTTRIQRLLI